MPDPRDLAARLLDDDASLSEAADDWGHMVHQRPRAVVRPRSREELVAIVEHARAQGLKLAARGRGHSVLGQAQAEDGLVLDMRSLNAIASIDSDSDSVWVEGGASWRELLELSLAKGLAPPVLTDYLDLSVGGTLSVGGLGSQTFRAGLQVDNVLELEVVTGEGEVSSCSATDKRELFDLVRGGLGQFGLISRARLRLEPTPPMARFTRLLYSELEPFLADMFELTRAARCTCVEGFALPNSPEGVAQVTGDAFPDAALPVGEGAWIYMIEVVQTFAPGEEPDSSALPETALGGGRHQMDLPYAAYLARLDLVEAALREVGLWAAPHPWIDVFVPRSAAPEFLRDELAATSPMDVAGPVLIYAFNRAPIAAPNIPLPASEEFVLFALLRNAVPPTPERAQELMRANARLYAHCLELGGTGYAIDAVPLEPSGWRRHFGERWSTLAEAKRRYDPAAILAPNQRLV